MAPHYVNWIDAAEHLDKTAYDEDHIDQGHLQQLCEDAEEAFDRRLQRRFDVPFDESTNPDSFDLAKKIVSRIAAADYMEWSRQVEGTEDKAWYARRLRDDAEIFYGFLESRRAPTDAEDPDDPLVYVPTDGLASTDTTTRPAFATRDHITAGNSSHW